MNPNLQTWAQLFTLIAALGGFFVWQTHYVDKRLETIERRFEDRFAAIERRLEIIEANLKEFFKILFRHETDIARLKDKSGLG